MCRVALASTCPKVAQGIWSGDAFVPAEPFAMAELLTPQLWQALSIVLSEAR